MSKQQKRASWIVGLPKLSDDQLGVAQFRGRDALWAAVGDLYDRYREEGKVSYASLGDRIGKRRSQVQRWLARPVNMTLASAGLLAEGLDADLHIEIRPRDRSGRANEAHPSEEARCVLISRKPLRMIGGGDFYRFNDGQNLEGVVEDVEDAVEVSPSKVVMKKVLDGVA